MAIIILNCNSFFFIQKSVAAIVVNNYNILPAQNKPLFCQGNIVRSVDISQGREYTYTYEEGKIVRAAEHTIEVNSSDIITSRTFEKFHNICVRQGRSAH